MNTRTSAEGVSPGRAVAYTVLRRVFEQDAWADRALHAEAERAGLDPRERALATRLAYGAVQRKATLDHVAGVLARRDPATLDPPVLAGLRLGLHQLVHLDRIPPHAAVGESVELVKAVAPRAAGFVNAVLRRGAREGRRIVAGLADRTPEQAALKHSYPEWIAQLWFDALGPEAARGVLAAGNEPAESAIRANALRIAAPALAARLGAPSHPADPWLPEGLVLDGPLDVFATPEWEQGLLMPQSRAAMTVAHALAPRPGDRVLDLCAAPGGKTTHLAALLGADGDGAVVAVEAHPGRADALRRTARRMGTGDRVEVRTADARGPHEPGAYDRVLVDPPCSDLGTLAARPDARWRKQGRPEALAPLQTGILLAGVDALRPGGTLVYSTCTISPSENEEVVQDVLGRRPDLELEDLAALAPGWTAPTMPQTLQTLPHRDRTDGFFIARLRRAAG